MLYNLEWVCAQAVLITSSPGHSRAEAWLLRWGLLFRACCVVPTPLWHPYPALPRVPVSPLPWELLQGGRTSDLCHLVLSTGPGTQQTAEKR